MNIIESKKSISIKENLSGKKNNIKQIKDISTPIFCNVFLEDKKNSSNFVTFVYHYIYSSICTELNMNILEENKNKNIYVSPISNDEFVQLIFKGGALIKYIYDSIVNKIDSKIDISTLIQKDRKKIMYPINYDVIGKSRVEDIIEYQDYVYPYNNIVVKSDVQVFFENIKKYFTMSDIDFSMYIYTDTNERFLLLYNHIIKILIDAINNITQTFDNYIESVKNDVNYNIIPDYNDYTNIESPKLFYDSICDEANIIIKKCISDDRIRIKTANEFSLFMNDNTILFNYYNNDYTLAELISLRLFEIYNFVNIIEKEMSRNKIAYSKIKNKIFDIYQYVEFCTLIIHLDYLYSSNFFTTFRNNKYYFSFTYMTNQYNSVLLYNKLKDIIDFYNKINLLILQYNGFYTKDKIIDFTKKIEEYVKSENFIKSVNNKIFNIPVYNLSSKIQHGYTYYKINTNLNNSKIEICKSNTFNITKTDIYNNPIIKKKSNDKKTHYVTFNSTISTNKNDGIVKDFDLLRSKICIKISDFIMESDINIKNKYVFNNPTYKK